MKIFSGKILIIFLFFAQNFDCGYMLEAVLTSTHNLCFGTKISKISIPLQTPVLLYIKVGYEGVYFSWTCFPDELASLPLDNMSRIVRKPDFCLCENKGADQLRGNREADQRLCFRYTDSIFPLLLISEISSF